MDYKGRALPLEPGDIERVAQSINVPEASMRAIIEVEARGEAFDSQGRPIFLFEPHKFHDHVPKSLLDDATRQGLAYPDWKGPGSYPKTLSARWAQFLKAAEMHETAAIKSASWGLGQIMGSEYKETGHSSPQQMLEAFCDSELNQLQGMANLIKARKLDIQMRKFPSMTACRAFAKRYNGRSYEKNRYHTKIQSAYNKWVKRLGDKPISQPKDDGTLRIGAKDRIPNGPIRVAQQMLKDLGYSLKSDGDFGPGTRAAVLAWQANSGRPITGELSPADLKVLPESQPMPVQEERVTATVQDLKPDSAIIRQSSTLKKTVGWSGGILAGLSSLDFAGLLDTTRGYIDNATGFFGSIKALLAATGITDLARVILEWRFLILCGVVIAAFFIATNIQRKRLEMHHKAEIG